MQHERQLQMAKIMSVDLDTKGTEAVCGKDGLPGQRSWLGGDGRFTGQQIAETRIRPPENTRISLMSHGQPFLLSSLCKD